MTAWVLLRPMRRTPPMFMLVLIRKLRRTVTRTRLDPRASNILSRRPSPSSDGCSMTSCAASGSCPTQQPALT